MSAIPPEPVQPRSASILHDSHEAESPRRFGLLLPHFALVLLIASIVLLVWLVREYDTDEQQATLISDVLWMEQSLRFLLDRNESILRQIGPDLLGAARLSAQAEAQLKQLMRQDRSLIRIFWLGPDGTPMGAFPPQPHGESAGEDGLAVASSSSATLAHAVGRAVYGPAYSSPDDHHYFEVHTPAWSGETFLGTVTGVYSLSDLISRELPWWFSRRYRVEVLDADGREIAAKTKIAPLEDQRSYTTPFDPPGHGLMLRITAYRGETRWMPLLLIASIVLFGAITAWSIWQLRLQLARRQSAEAALRRETAFRNAMENSVITGLRARDRQGRLTHVNPAFCRMVGYSAEELIARPPPMPYWDPEYLERTQEMHDIIMAGGTPREGMELRLRRKDGTRLDALIFEAPLIDSQGRHSGWMGSVLDITEQKRAEELARQQEERLQATSRLITMGEMASTLAHELNQPLAAISSYNSGCIYRLDAGGEIDRAELRDIHARLGRQAQRAGEIIRRVHDFVRRSEPKRVPVDINTIIRGALELFEGDARKRRIRLLTQLADRLPEIDADPVMIEQILVNLMRNAMDAMRDNPADRRTVRITTGLEDNLLVVRVADLGHGISPETSHRLFEPFFTTKQEGMGMGLNICRSIAELHRGRLGFEANPEGGTIFILSLPVQPA